MRVRITSERCIGVGNCVELAPDTFKLDDETGVAVLRVDQVADDEIETVTAAAESCPVEAILLDQ